MGKRDFPEASVTSSYEHVHIYPRNPLSEIKTIRIDPRFPKALRAANMDKGIRTAVELIKALEA